LEGKREERKRALTPFMLGKNPPKCLLAAALLCCKLIEREFIVILLKSAGRRNEELERSCIGHWDNPDPI